MNDLMQTLASEPEFLVTLVIVPLGVLLAGFTIWQVCRAAMRNTQQREETKRELAAYIAEGTISSDDAAKLLYPKPWYADTLKSAKDEVAASVKSCC